AHGVGRAEIAKWIARLGVPHVDAAIVFGDELPAIGMERAPSRQEVFVAMLQWFADAFAGPRVELPDDLDLPQFPGFVVVGGVLILANEQALSAGVEFQVLARAFELPGGAGRLQRGRIPAVYQPGLVLARDSGRGEQ